MKKIISQKELAAIANEIFLLGDNVLIVASMPDQRFYMHDQCYLSDLLSLKLGDMFPDLDQDDLDMICNATAKILEQPLIEIRYFENKDERDQLIQKKLSPRAQEAIKNSISRATNMRNLYTTIEMLLPGEFEQFINAIKARYSLQLKSKDPENRIKNAKDVRDLTTKFCLGIIGKYPL